MTEDRNVWQSIWVFTYLIQTYLFKTEISLFINISRQMQVSLFEIQISLIKIKIYVLEIEISIFYVKIEKSAFKLERSVFQWRTILNIDICIYE